MLVDEHLDEIGYGPMLTFCRQSEQLLQFWCHAEVESCRFLSHTFRLHAAMTM